MCYFSVIKNKNAVITKMVSYCCVKFSNIDCVSMNAHVPGRCVGMSLLDGTLRL